MEEIEFRYDTQLLLDVAKPSDDIEDELDEYIRTHFKGDSLLVIADEDDNGVLTAKLHFHTNEPWLVLEYCRSLGEIYDIVVEDMIRQSRGQKG